MAAVHVDDFLSVASHKAENEQFKEQMKKIWTISDLGEPKFCVGIGISRSPSTRMVYLSQTALIDKVVGQFGQSDAYPVSTPMDSGLKLRRPDRKSISADDQEHLAKLPYRSLVGCLIYLSIGTRPDITYAVQQLSQFLDNFSYAHWNAAIRVVRYPAYYVLGLVVNSPSYCVVLQTQIGQTVWTPGGVLVVTFLP
jgi:hypothetical protein